MKKLPFVKPRPSDSAVFSGLSGSTPGISKRNGCSTPATTRRALEPLGYGLSMKIMLRSPAITGGTVISNRVSAAAKWRLQKPALQGFSSSTYIALYRPTAGIDR